MLNSQLWTIIAVLLLLQFSHINAASCDEANDAQRSCSSLDYDLVQRELPAPSTGAYNAELEDGFPPGSVLILTGKATGTPNWGRISLKTVGGDGSESMDLQLGHWDDNKDSSSLSFQQGELFNIIITSDEEQIFKVCVNGAFLSSYKHHAEEDAINTLQVDGDLALMQVLYFTPPTEEPSSKNCTSGSSLQEHVLKSPTSGPYITPLDYGFKKGSILVISGDILDNENWGFIDLVSESDKFVALHFNLRFDQGAVVRNSYVDGQWGEEERSGGIPFQIGEKFHVTIKSEGTDFLIYVNGKLFTTFKLDVDVSKIDSLRVRGVFNANEINYYTLEKC